MLRINSFSDIHLEFYDIKNLPKLKLSDNLDILIIVGDTIKGSKKGIQQEYKEWLLHHASQAKYLLYVAGNHEYYSNRRDLFIREFNKFSEGTNIKLLVDDVFIYENYKFIGSDLWTDYKYNGEIHEKHSMTHKKYITENISDFRFIKTNENGFRKLNLFNILKWNCDSKRFIFEELNKNDGYKNILLTHFGVTPKTLSDFDKKSVYVFHDTNDWEDEIFKTNNPPIYLFSGHSHCFKHIDINEKCKLFMNCGGYNHINKITKESYLIPDFKSDYLITI